MNETQRRQLGKLAYSIYAVTYDTPELEQLARAGLAVEWAGVWKITSEGMDALYRIELDELARE
jgi:hypothetical protein